MVKTLDECKDEIYVLYIRQRKSLKEVRRMIKGRHDFDASDRSYKSKLKEWGYLKNKPRRQNPPRNSIRSTPVPVVNNAPSPPLTTDALVGFDNLYPSFPTPPAVLIDRELWGSVPISNTGAGSSNRNQYTRSHISPNRSSPDNGSFSLNAQDNDGKTQLHRAVIEKSEEEVYNLLSGGAAVNLKDNAGNQPLHYAVIGSFKDAIKLLLRFGADPDAKGQSGRTALHMSLHSKEITEIILGSHPMISSQDENGDTPLHLASSMATPADVPSFSVTASLLASGAEVNAINLAGITPFHIVLDRHHATWEHYEAWIVMFLENRASISLQTRDQRLPFKIFLDRCGSSWAGYQGYGYGNFRANNDFRLFINKGADTNTRLKSGELILHYSLRQEIFRNNRDWKLGLLLCNSADVNVVGASGNFPLHEIASRLGNCYYRTHATEFVKVLLSRNANPNQLNLVGESPLATLLSSKASKNDIVEIAEMLLKAGADPILGGSADKCAIYRAARNPIFQKLGKRLPITVFDHDFHSIAADGEYLWWLQSCDIAVQTGDWALWKHSIQAADHYLQEEVREIISRTALAVGAENCIEKAKKKFEDSSVSQAEQIDGHRGYVAGILRDCRKINVNCDPKYYDYLLGLCIQESSCVPPPVEESGI